MADYAVRFNKNMDGISFDKIAKVGKFLNGSVNAGYGGDDEWEVTTDKDLNLKLMNNALGYAGISDRTTVSVEEIDDT